MSYIYTNYYGPICQETLTLKVVQKGIFVMCYYSVCNSQTWIHFGVCHEKNFRKKTFHLELKTQKNV